MKNILILKKQVIYEEGVAQCTKPTCVTDIYFFLILFVKQLPVQVKMGRAWLAPWLYFLITRLLSSVVQTEREDAVLHGQF